MRIDDENKVVVPDFVADYIEKHYDDKLPSSWDKADLIRDWDNYISVSDRKDVAEWIKNPDNFLVFVIAIATDNYMAEPQKYYWRKKKEHLAWFENHENFYLTKDFIERVGLDNLENEGTYKWYKFSEDLAKNLLKDDFDKFEKVECE